MYYRYLYLIKKRWAWPPSSGAWVIIPTLNTESPKMYRLIPNPTGKYFYS